MNRLNPKLVVADDGPKARAAEDSQPVVTAIVVTVSKFRTARLTLRPGNSSHGAQLRVEKIPPDEPRPDHPDDAAVLLRHREPGVPPDVPGLGSGAIDVGDCAELFERAAQLPAIPPFPAISALGLDGVSYSIRIESMMDWSEHHWWMRTPPGWGPLAKLVDDVLRVARPHLGYFP